MAADENNLDVQNMGFPSIMDLPVETRAKIFCRLEQKYIPNVRLVCQQWRDEADRYYEFRLSVSTDYPDFLERIYDWRCNDCTIWIIKTNLDNRGLFRYPKYMKRLKIYGPLTPTNLQRLMSDFVNLEQLTISRRVSCPWILNLSDTPHLAHLHKLKHLCLRSENYIQVQRMKGDVSRETTYNLPMVDCYFPALENFEVFKRFPKTHSVMVQTYILKFLARHAKTIKNIDISLHPNSTRQASIIEQERNGIDNVSTLYSLGRDISADKIDLETLKSIRLKKCTVTANGCTRDAMIWKNVFEKQDELEDFKFEWFNCDHRNGIRERVAGFPWTYLQMPVTQSCQFLVTVEFVGLSMIGSANGRLPQTEILPFDMFIFRTCSQLKNLTLRCQENHGMVEFPIPPEMFREIAEGEEELDLMDFPEVDPPEVPLIVNGSELPASVEKLDICSLRMFTTDLEDVFRRCTNLTTLYLKDCGRSGALGMTGRLIYEIANLKNLKFLEIIGFNEVGRQVKDEETDLERVCQVLGIDYCEDDTEVIFDKGNSLAYDELRVLVDSDRRK